MHTSAWGLRWRWPARGGERWRRCGRRRCSNPTFTVPPEAGKKAMALAERARRDQRRIGSLAVSAQVPEEVASAAPFGVDVALAPSKSAIIDAVSLEVRDPLAVRAYKQSAPPDSRIHFEVPTRMTLPDASLLIRVRVVDVHENELISFEKHIHVARATTPPPPAVIAALRPHGNNRSHASSSSSGGGFWNTAWPYVIGGVALAAGGAAVYFGTRPTADAYVAPARVELVP